MLSFIMLVKNNLGVLTGYMGECWLIKVILGIMLLYP